MRQLAYLLVLFVQKKGFRRIKEKFSEAFFLFLNP
jgi:hypothetical protein